MEFKEVIHNRRSIRKFKNTPVPEEAIDTLLEAARVAPSGSNLQPWRYVIVTDETMRAKIAATSPLSFLKEAPLIIVALYDMEAMDSRHERTKELEVSGIFQGVTLDKRKAVNLREKRRIDEVENASYLAYNAAISITHLLLQAEDLGLGGIWLGMFDKDEVAQLIDVDSRYRVMSLLAIGYADQTPDARPRLTEEEIVLKRL